MNHQRQKNAEHVSKWRAEIASLSSAKNKLQEAVVLQNIFESILVKSITIFCEMTTIASVSLNKLASCLFNDYLVVLKKLSDLHDKQQLMTRLLLSNISWQNLSTETSPYVRYFFPELMHEQTLDVFIPCLKLKNPVEPLLQLVGEQESLKQKQVLVNQSLCIYLGDPVLLNMGFSTQHGFKNAETFLKNPVSIVTLTIPLQTSTLLFNTVVFLDKSLISSKLYTPEIWVFKPPLTINASCFVVNWVDQGYAYKDIAKFPLLGSKSVVCSLYARDVVEWSRILPIELEFETTVTETYRLCLNAIQTFSATSSSSTIPTFSYTLVSQQTNLPNDIYTIHSYELKLSPLWIDLLQKISLFYSKLLEKFRMHKIRNETDLINIKFIAEMVRTQTEIKEDSIKLYASLK